MTGPPGAVPTGRRRTTTAAVALLASVAVLAGCGDGGGGGAGDGTTTTTTATTVADPGACPPATDPPPFVGSLALDVPPALASREAVTWQLTLTNRADQATTLVYPSSQRADVALLDADGTVAYRWSDGRSFAQAVRCEELAAGASTTFLLTTDRLDVPAGSYTARGEVLAGNVTESAERPVVVTG